MDPIPVVRRAAEYDAVSGSEAHQETAVGGDQTAARAGVSDDDEGRRHVIVITPEGGQCIGVRACAGAEHTVVSREDTRRYGAEKEVLARPFEVKGPLGILVRIEDVCVMVFPLGGPHGRRQEIPCLGCGHAGAVLRIPAEQHVEVAGAASCAAW
jgi:hypothetical protein